MLIIICVEFYCMNLVFETYDYNNSQNCQNIDEHILNLKLYYVAYLAMVTVWHNTISFMHHKILDWNNFLFKRRITFDSWDRKASVCNELLKIEYLA